MEVTIWGARGSVPNFHREKIQFGTNTSCISLYAHHSERIIFDAGTGIVTLGDEIEKGGYKGCDRIHVFFSHFHWDHIQGLPFFKPIYKKTCDIILYGQPGIQKAFSKQMMAPFFPIPFESLPAKIEIRTIHEPITIGTIKLIFFPLFHPQGCFGYRVEHENKVFVYATDTEPNSGRMDKILVENAKDADLLIMDSDFTLDEAKQRKGWGHSSWKDAVNTAKAANVKRLVLFHHDPFHNDTIVAEKEKQAQKEFPNTCSAFEGLVIEV